MLGERLGHLAKLRALDLEAVRRLRLEELRHGEHAHRHLVVGEPASAVGDHCLLVERGGRPEDLSAVVMVVLSVRRLSSQSFIGADNPGQHPPQGIEADLGVHVGVLRVGA